MGKLKNKKEGSQVDKPKRIFALLSCLKLNCLWHVATSEVALSLRHTTSQTSTTTYSSSRRLSSMIGCIHAFSGNWGSGSS